MRTLTGEYPYQKFGVGTSDLTFIPFHLMEKNFARLDDELMLLLISAHEVLGTLADLVRFAPNASALRTLLLKKDDCCSLQIGNKGISFYEMIQLTSALKSLNLSSNTVSKAVELLQKRRFWNW